MKKIIRISLFIVFSFLLGCSTGQKPVRLPASQIQAVKLEQGSQLLQKFSPVFLIEEFTRPYNLIGTPKARLNDENEEEVYVDPSQATIYTENRSFFTANGTYTNLLYRVHFREVPTSMDPFFLGAGQNPGLFIIVTLNSQKEPVLYTSVNTCGCYVAFLPTSYLKPHCYPDYWKRPRQKIYGENLPAYLDFSKNKNPANPVIFLIRSGSHRVKDVWLSADGRFDADHTVRAQQKALEDLTHLVRDDGQPSSFYETAGSRAGYVKSSQKIFERVLMSWWALDWRVGEDKRLGINKQDGPVFYTDLRPWARNASDMRDFKTFLEHWGWRL